MSECTPSGAMTAMSHESTGFCFCGAMHGRVEDWVPRDWEALKEQGSGWLAAHDAEVRAAALSEAMQFLYRVGHPAAGRDLKDMVADAVLVSLAKGRDV